MKYALSFTKVAARAMKKEKSVDDDINNGLKMIKLAKFTNLTKITKFFIEIYI